MIDVLLLLVVIWNIYVPIDCVSTSINTKIITTSVTTIDRNQLAIGRLIVGIVATIGADVGGGCGGRRRRRGVMMVMTI